MEASMTSSIASGSGIELNRGVEFRRSTKSTTHTLAQEFAAWGISASLTFENLVARITSADALKSAKGLLAQVESRLMLSESPDIPNIGSLLKRLSPPKANAPKREQVQERYPARVFLCAYMIIGHPEAVLSGTSEREAGLLAEAAAKLITEFQALVEALIHRSPGEAQKGRLLSFDKAWYSYLCRFVAWKLKDAQLMEEDLIRVACQLELSMLQKCRVGESSTHDAEAIKEEVLEDHRLLREKIVHLTGEAGVMKMEEALRVVRSKAMEAKANGVSLPPPSACSSADDPKPLPEHQAASSSSDKARNEISKERIVNEMMHDGDEGSVPEELVTIHTQVRGSIERAFWDSVEERVLREKPEYGQVVSLVGEIREELENIVPESWKQGLRDTVDLEIMAQVLNSGSNDFGHLRKLLEYTLNLIHRLGAPGRDDESMNAQRNLIQDLMNGDITKEAFGRALLKGIRFVFERLQVLKQDISKVYLHSLAQVLNGSAGVEFLQKAFGERIGLKPPVSDEELLDKLPRTAKWLREASASLETQRAEVEAGLSSLRPAQAPEVSQPAFPMQTGRRLGVGGASSSSNRLKSSEEELRMATVPVKWGSLDSIVRLGVLAIVSSSEAANEEQAPESMSLNVGRLRACQDEFQSIVVAATGLLLLRQELMTKAPGLEMEVIMSEAHQELAKILNNPTATIKQIGLLLAQICARNIVQQNQDVSASAEFLARVLNRSLSPGDPVFKSVLAAIKNSLRALLMMGNGGEGVDGSLKRIGGGVLAESVKNLAQKLDRIAQISSQVHGPLYSRLL